VLLDRNREGGPARATDYDSETALGRLSLAAGRGGAMVIGQLGQSLDGRICTPTGASKYINGREALRHLHRIRARVDAVVVGVGTAIADDPRLTTRHVPGPSPARVVIDPEGRMPGCLGMLSDGAGPVLSVGLPGNAAPAGAERIALEADGAGSIPPGAIVEALAARGLRRILVEGGAETLARFLDAGAVDELHLMVAPIVLGSGKTGLNLAPIESLDEALRPEVRTMRFRDGDILCICALEAARAPALPAAQAAARG
jgi:riboflavin-specific deaminase-like protein